MCLQLTFAAPVASWVGDGIKQVVETYLGQPVAPPVGSEPHTFGTLRQILGRYGAVNGKKLRENTVRYAAAKKAGDTAALAALEKELGKPAFASAKASADGFEEHSG